jgi:hypothetical protein
LSRSNAYLQLLDPSEQTTVASLLAGTTTVVLSGGGALLLLMQPASPTSKQTEARTIFMTESLLWIEVLNLSGTVTASGCVAFHPDSAPAVGPILLLQCL